MKQKVKSVAQHKRLLSLDAFRGMAMFMVLIEHSHLNYILYAIFSKRPVFDILVKQLQHHKWNGLYLWDVAQPFFMFIIGVAMAYSLGKRLANGGAWSQAFKYILYRCFVLFLLGLILQINIRGTLTFELWNVLTTLSFSILITFLIFRFSKLTQIIISFSLLIIYEMLFQFVSIPGFDQPFIKGHNLGAYLDILLMGKTHPDGWVAIAAVSTTAHMIWGVLTGKMLLSSIDQSKKLKYLVLVGVAGIAAGYGIDWVGIAPINKHLSTSSFVIASGGMCFVILAFLYWLIDIKGYKKWTIVLTVVGMNPIFIFVFSSTIGRIWLNGFVAIFVEGFMDPFVNSTGIINGTSSLLVICFEWYLCYWLYKRKILIKI